MGLNFVVTEGERKGDRFRLSAGITVGRSKTNIALRDAKVSSHHARIELDHNGGLVLIDNNSANGIWANGIKQEKIVLAAGLLIRIGNTVLQVVDDFEMALEEGQRDTWQGKVWTYLNLLASRPTSHPKTQASVFDPALELTFTRGPQAGERCYLGYGPRKIGAASTDLPIDDPTALDVCFELWPDKQGIVFKTEYPDRVRLNDKSVESEILRDGDIITFGDNEIRIAHK